MFGSLEGVLCFIALYLFVLLVIVLLANAMDV